MTLKKLAKNCLGTLKSRLVTIIGQLQTLNCLSSASTWACRIVCLLWKLRCLLLSQISSWEPIIQKIKLGYLSIFSIYFFSQRYDVQKVGVCIQGVSQQQSGSACFGIFFTTNPNFHEIFYLTRLLLISDTWRSKVEKIFFFKASMAKTQILTGAQIPHSIFFCVHKLLI